jgi:hypothetical protein
MPVVVAQEDTQEDPLEQDQVVQVALVVAGTEAVLTKQEALELPTLEVAVGVEILVRCLDTLAHPAVQAL